MEKYCTPGQATDDNRIRRMRIACWIPKATNTHSEYVNLLFSPMQQRFTNAPKCHVIRTVLVLLQSRCSVYCAVRNEALHTVQVSLKD